MISTPECIQLPLSKMDITKLVTGRQYRLNGVIYTARDAAHRRMIALIDQGRELPFDLAQSTIFYCGPSPRPDGKICGSIGPTTSSRMDEYMPHLMQKGLLVTIGKGERSQECMDTIRTYGGAYFTCSGGIAALLSKCVVSCETWAWPDLGTEAIYRMVVADFPVFLELA